MLNQLTIPNLQIQYLLENFYIMACLMQFSFRKFRKDTLFFNYGSAFVTTLFKNLLSK